MPFDVVKALFLYFYPINRHLGRIISGKLKKTLDRPLCFV